MKFTLSEAVEALKTAGVKDAEIVDDGSDYNKETFLTTVDSARSEILEPQIAKKVRDEEIDKIKAQQGGALRSKLVRFTGIKRSDLDEIKNDEEAMDKAFGYKSDLLGSDQQKADEEIKKILQAHQEEKEVIKSTYEKQISEANEKYIQKEEVEYLATLLDGAPLPNGSNRLIHAKDWRGDLKSRIDLRFDEQKGKFVPYQKGTDLPLLNETKTDSYNLLTDAKGFFEPRGVWQTDTRNVNPSDAMNGRGQNNDSPPERKITNNLADKKSEFNEKMKTLVAQQ